MKELFEKFRAGGMGALYLTDNTDVHWERDYGIRS
jgi:hypothetical protein